MTRLIPLATLLAAIAFALSPVFSSGFNGFAPDRFPVPQYDPPIQPAGWAFSIWLPIYAWLVISATYGLFNRAEDPAWQRVRPPLLVSLIVGTAWIPVANASPIWSTVLIWIMWAGAALALIRSPRADRWWLRAPIGLYAGWLTAASCVATAVLITGYGGTPVLAIHATLLLLALALGSLILRRTPSPAYAFALVWALFGITVANLDPLRPMMIALAVIGAALLIWPLLRRIRR